MPEDPPTQNDFKNLTRSIDETRNALKDTAKENREDHRDLFAKMSGLQKTVYEKIFEVEVRCMTAVNKVEKDSKENFAAKWSENAVKFVGASVFLVVIVAILKTVITTS